MGGGAFDMKDPTKNLMAAFANAAAGKPSVELDVRAYLMLLDEMDASEAEKLEFLEVVAGMMGAFVDIGFGIHPVQQACGECAENAGIEGKNGSDVIGSEPSKRRHE